MQALLLLLSAPPDALRLLLFTIRLLPIPPSTTSDVDTLYRMELVAACVEATEDRLERYLCAKIPRFESSYRVDIGRCEVKGAAGEVTAWQILPRSAAERARLCRSMVEDARVAIERIRESRGACRHLPKAEQLALYTRGRCDSDEAKRLSRVRWPYEHEVRAVESAE